MTSLECGGGDRILSREAFEPASWEMQVWRKGISSVPEAIAAATTRRKLRTAC